MKTEFIDDLLLAAVRRHPQFQAIPEQEWLFFDMALHAVKNHPCVCFRYKSETSWRAQVWLDLSSTVIRVRVNCIVSFQEAESEIARLGVTLCGFDRPTRKQDKIVLASNEDSTYSA